MSSRRAVPLTGELTARLPAPCRDCLFWELGAPCPQPRTGHVPGAPWMVRAPSDPGSRKQSWVSDRVRESTPPGSLIELDGEVAAWVLFAPAERFAPRASPVPAPDRGALLLATAWVEPTHRELGLGRLLVQAALREAVRLGRPTVQAYGDRRWQQRACVLPATWLLHEGFEVRREHRRLPLLSVETRRLSRWASSLEHALDELLGRVPRRVPGLARERGRVPVPDAADAGAEPGR